MTTNGPEALQPTVQTDVRGAFQQGNQTNYGTADPEKVFGFLEEHRGKRVFTVSW